MSGAVVGIIVLAIAGCSSSPKEELIESADEKCRTISKRFAGGLAYGKGIGSSDVPKLRKRVALLKDLRDHVGKMPKPETGQAELDDWSGKLGKYITELDDLSSQFQNARMGMDMLLAMQMSIVDNAAKAVGPAGKRFGFKDCARTENWEHIDS
jgi:hypothetical protein